MITFQRFHHENGLVPQSGYYRLVVSPLCPWCRRVAITRRLLGLEEALAVSEAPGAGPDGFEFSDAPAGIDPYLKVRSTRELYRRQKDWNVGDSTSVPVVVDENNKIVAGESTDLMMDLINEWTSLHTKKIDLYPREERDELDSLDKEIESRVVAHIYAAVHDEGSSARDLLSSGLDWIDSKLAHHKYVSGDAPRESDIRLFANLTSAVGHLPLEKWSHVQQWWNSLASSSEWLSEGEKEAFHISRHGLSSDKETTPHSQQEVGTSSACSISQHTSGSACSLSFD